MDSAQADCITDRQLSIVFTSKVDLEVISVFVFFLTSPEIEIDSQLFLDIFNNWIFSRICLAPFDNLDTQQSIIVKKKTSL